MNNLIFNRTAEQLHSTVYGKYGDQTRPVAVDTGGQIVFSSSSIFTITATNLDIRDLTAARDTVNVTATDLDIRDLNGSQDSVQISSKSFVTDTLSTSVSSGTTYLLVKNIGNYSENSFFIRNTGSATITVTLQVSPVDDTDYYTNNGSAQSATTSSRNIVFAVTVPAQYARLQVLANTNVSLVAYYNGRA